MPLVEILFNVVAGGGPRKPGDRLDLPGPEARLLVGAKRARLVEQLPVVIEESPSTPPAKPKRARKTKAPTEGGANPVPEVTDGPPSDS